MNHWLMKSEPEAFGIDDLRACPKQTNGWDGVRNYQARNFMRDSMSINDQVLFYHSNCKIPGIAGIAKIVSDSYPDYTQFDPESKYFDPKSTKDKPRWFLRDVKFVKKFKDVIPLQDLRDNRKLQTMQILQKGNRLSITPVTKAEWETILQIAEKK